MTIKELLAELNKADPKFKVIFDFCGCTPTCIDSYRGDIESPALGWRPTGFGARERSAILVSDLIRDLTEAIDGREFQAWKGDMVSFTGDEILYVDNPGNCFGTAVERVEIFRTAPAFVVLHTEWKGEDELCF